MRATDVEKRTEIPSLRNETFVRTMRTYFHFLVSLAVTLFIYLLVSDLFA